MSRQLTAGEIAALKGVTLRAVRKRAQKENWPYSERKQRGGTVKVFDASTLPEDIRLLINKDVVAAAPVVPDVIPAHVAKFFKKDAGPSRADGPCPVITPKQKDKALGKYDLLRLYNERVSQAPYGQKVQVRDSFIEAYNSGLMYPELRKALGLVSWKTVEGWKRDVSRAGNDGFVLADKRGAWKRGASLIGVEHEKILLACLLHPNAPKIAESIRYAREIMHHHGIENGFSDATYRRFISWWKERNYDLWTFTREGWKAWNDKCALSGERDYDLIEVGDVLVGDGHTLNFDIINPWTGKPKRMTLMLWYDMKSSYPMGWEILPNENTQGIASAMRWAIIRLGKIPGIAYTDNGKGYRSKFMEGSKPTKGAVTDGLDFDLTAGLFERLGIKVINAIAYRGQSKTVERFFGTFAELERWAPTYTGTSIATKPPGMARGEKFHRKLRARMVGDGITLEQAYVAIADWFDRYVDRPQQDGHLKGMTPREVFEAGRGPGVDREMLNDLMMTCEVKSVRRSAIQFTHPSCESRQYYHPDLHGRTHKVLIQYDFQDPSYIRVSELTGELICVARPYAKLHPAAGILGTDDDKARLSEHCAELKRQERQASSLAREFLNDEFLPAHKEHMSRIGIDTAAKAQDKADVIALARPAKQIPETTISDEEWAAIQAGADGMNVDVVASVDAVDLYAEPELLEDAVTLRARLEGLPERDRYLAIMEMDVRGMIVPGFWRDFARYFEMTSMYLDYEDEFEEIRGRLMVAWQRDDVRTGTLGRRDMD